MKQILTYIIYFAIISCNTYLLSQTISFERTDVQGKSADFITATYSFGIDIRLDNIEHCSNVAFELVHDKAKYVQYSEMKPSQDWGEKNYALVYKDPNIDPDSDIERIIVETGTGRLADSKSPNNPKIIHLEFVVLPSAIHGEIVDFRLDSVIATVYRDTVVDLILPSIPKISYKVHSYVTVWPGDADNNGIVEGDNDHSIISKYLYQKMRSFKREPASTLWQPQQVIAWDTLSATYADCDGNGVITNSDQMIVRSNIGKTHMSAPKIQDIILNGNRKHIALTENTLYIPITINPVYNLSAIAGTVDISSYKNCKIIGLETAEYFDKNDCIYYWINSDSNWVNFVISQNDEYYNANNNKSIIGYLLLEPESNQLPIIAIDDFVGITSFNSIITLDYLPAISSIGDNKADDIEVNYDNGILYVFLQDNSNAYKSISITNALGSKIAEYSTEENCAMYNISHFPNGIYFVTTDANNKKTFSKFIK